MVIAVCLVASTCASLPAYTQVYPSKPIRMIVGFPVGGVTDIMARIVGQKLGEGVGQQIVVDNRPGAGSGIAAEMAARAAPDGYTLLMMGASHAVNAGLQRTLPYHPVKDFAAVILVASAPQVLVAHLAAPVRSITDLIDQARARPGQLNFGSSGTGSTSHLAGELLKSMANINLTHVPYKGLAQAMTDVISGQMPLLFFSLPAALPQIKAGRVRAIAVTSSKRSGGAPNIPTIAESGVAGYEASSWSGVLAPAATPKLIIARLNAEILRALRATDVVDSITRQGADPLGGTPDQFERYLKTEVEKWAKVIRDAGLRPD